MTPFRTEPRWLPPPGLTLRAELDGLGHCISYMSWCPEGATLAVATGKSLAIWNADSESRLTPLWELQSEVSLAVWAPGGEALALAERNGKVSVWSPEGLKRLRLEGSRTLALAWAPSGEELYGFFLAGEAPGDRIVAWAWKPDRNAEGRLRTEIAAKEAYSALSPDRSLLALTLPSGSLEIWDLSTLTLIAVLPVDYLPIYSLSIDPQRRLLALGGDISLGGETTSLGEDLPLGGDHGMIQIWDLSTKQRQKILTEHDRPVYSLAFSSDGHFLASKSRDGKVRLWDRDTWKLLATLEEPSLAQEELELAFHPRRPCLASGGRKNTRIRIWDLDPGQLRGLQFWDGRMITILFLSANPSDQKNLKLGEELRTLRKMLQLSEYRSYFDLQARFEVRVEDLSQYMIRHKPRIVHFSGHGLDNGKLLINNELGQSHPLSVEALKSLFRLQSDTTECVVLNACYSRRQSEAIVRYVDYVIGMKSTIGDRDAIAFTLGFYQALGGGETIPRAFEYAKTQIALKNLPGDQVPELLQKKRSPGTKKREEWIGSS